MTTNKLAAQLAIGVATLLADMPLHAGLIGEGAELSAIYTGEILRNQRGGLNAGSAYLDNFDLTLDIDAEQWLGWQGGRWFAYALYNNGAAFSGEHVGDAQGASNIETVRAWRLYELWYEQSLGDGRASVRAGLYDLNAEFYATDSSSLFMHPAHGIGTDFAQSGEMGPSIFSITGLALRFHHDASEQWSWRAVLLDGVPGDPEHPQRTVVNLRGEEGLLAVAELDFHPGNYRLGVGGWRYSRPQPLLVAENAAVTADEENGAISWGSYGFSEFALSTGSLDVASVRGFLRAGVAEDSVNRFADFIGVGIVVDGSLWGRAEDDFGVALARARNGSRYRSTVAIDASETETAIEVSYRLALHERVTLQPDIQYIIDPDTNPQLDNAWVLGVRAELALY